MSARADRAAHTPGPWQNDNGLVTGMDSRVRYTGASSVDIFDASEWPEELCDEAYANACLIAAGPEMLEALKATRQLLQRQLNEPERTVFWKVVDAIVKAEGRQS